MERKRVVAAGVAAGALAVGGLALARTDIGPLEATATTTVQAAPVTMGCNDWPVNLSVGECQAAGTIRFVALVNLQGAAQFCKWKAANPGEWARLKGYALTSTLPTAIVTWMGNAIRNQLEAYFVTGAPPGPTPPNTAPNICGGKIVSPPTIVGVTPGETDATVTVTTTP